MDDKRKQKNEVESKKEQSDGAKKIVIKPDQESTKSKRATSLEESIALLKEIGFRTISNKTFINPNDLEAFLEGEFSGINKTRAFGFIQILEREYPVDLSELKEAYLAYFKANNASNNHTLHPPFVFSKEQEEQGLGRYLIWLLLLVGMGLLGWLFLSGKSPSTKVEKVAIATDNNSNVVKEAKESLVDPQQMESEKEKAQENLLNEVLAQDVKVVEINKSDQESDLDLDAIVKEMIEENNITIEQEENKTVVTPTQTSEQNSTIAPKNTTVSEKNEVVVSTIRAVPIATASKEPVAKEVKSVKQKIGNKSTFYIEPTKKTWIGIIYLDDMSKKDYLVKKSFKLDPSRPQLIIVGHKYFEIFNKSFSYRFRARGPVRFVYKDGDLMEITKKEFDTYRKGVHW